MNLRRIFYDLFYPPVMLIPHNLLLL